MESGLPSQLLLHAYHHPPSQHSLFAFERARLFERLFEIVEGRDSLGELATLLEALREATAGSYAFGQWDVVGVQDGHIGVDLMGESVVTCVRT